MRNAHPVRSNARRSWATISSRAWVSQVGVSVEAWIVVGDLLEQLERRCLRGGRTDLAATEVLKLWEEGRVDGDLLRARVLEDDHRPARALALALAIVRSLAESCPCGRQHGDGQLAPVRDGVVALGVVHLRQVVVVALGESGDRRLERRGCEQVVRSGHLAQYGAACRRAPQRHTTGARCQAAQIDRIGNSVANANCALR